MTTREHLNFLAENQIIILDGAMGSVIQVLNLDENSYRGSLFKNHPVPLAGCNDLLCLTRPGAIGAIHDTYLEAGADIIETCSFNSTSISLSDYGLGHLSYEISAAAAEIARKSADKFSGYGKRRFVAGSIGPTAKGASLYPDINNPGIRSITWDQLETSYYDNVRGLLDGGADILLVETVFDTLNAKAALHAITRLLEERQIDIPIIISATAAGDSGRLLSGQALEAFLVSILHVNPWAVGLNCSFHAPKLLPHLRIISDMAPCLVSFYPNAGVPNKYGRYDETPAIMANNIEPFFQENLVNIIGGCCGSSPAHISEIAKKAQNYPPRDAKKQNSYNFWGVFSGLEPYRIPHNSIQLRDPDISLNEFTEALEKGEYEEASDIARDIIESSSSVLNIEIFDTKKISEDALNSFLDYALMNPYIAKAPFFINCPELSFLNTALKRLQGRCLAGCINLKDGDEEFLGKIRLIRNYGAAAVVQLIDEHGIAVSNERRIEIAKRIYQLLLDNNYPADNIVLDPLVSDKDPFCKWIQDNCPGIILAL
ncbi:MAG: homocysteine S-methyltransferase family protein [Treponema sp.]|nr:homocysteine S-methyltransferase family protein [Treponema sp.]